MNNDMINEITAMLYECDKDTLKAIYVALSRIIHK